ncbi:MAG: D-2-hydroxyacid dehydrogenase [Thiotrichales bacterium]
MQAVNLATGVVLDSATFDRGDINYAALHRALPTWRMYPLTDPGETVARLAECEVVVTNKALLDRTMLESAPRLRYIGVAATGYNNVDVQTAAALGITVCNVRDYATASVVQHVYAVLLELARRTCDYRAALADGAWSRARTFCLLDYPITDLAGKVLGIIGYGVLGQAVAAAAPAFGLSVKVAERIGVAPRPGRYALDEVIASADILSLHCPLTPETAGMINAASLGRMQSSAWLINTARGGLIDEPALAAALYNGVIAAAALDVLSVEPPPPDNPLIALLPRPNLLITPHIAWAARSARQKLIDEVGQSIEAFALGQPRNLVQP